VREGQERIPAKLWRRNKYQIDEAKVRGGRNSLPAISREKKGKKGTKQSGARQVKGKTTEMLEGMVMSPKAGLEGEDREIGF